jgi:hypothetical protein
MALLLARGIPTSVVAKIIGASPQSVTNARLSIRRKLSAPQGVQLAAFLRTHLEPAGDHEDAPPPVAVVDERRVQLLLRATVVDLARLAGRTSKRARDLSTATADPLAQLESGHLQAVAQHVRALHDALLTTLRDDLSEAS